MTEALLRAVGVSHAFAGALVLANVELELRPGRLVVVVGPNGAGKTTLLRVLSGTLWPDAGEITLRGRPLHALARREIARQLAVVPQESQVPFPFRVREMIALGRAPFLGALGREGPRDRALTESALAQLDLLALTERAYPSLSGGEKQRVLLARALAQDVSTWLLDEPTAHMDLGHRLRAWEWLRDWVAGESGRGCLLVTHDLVLAARFADELVLLAGGRVAARGAPEVVLTPARIAEVYGVEARVGRDPDGRLELSPVRSLPTLRGQDRSRNIR